MNKDSMVKPELQARKVHVAKKEDRDPQAQWDPQAAAETKGNQESPV